MQVTRGLVRASPRRAPRVKVYASSQRPLTLGTRATFWQGERVRCQVSLARRKSKALSAVVSSYAPAALQPNYALKRTVACGYGVSCYVLGHGRLA